MHSSLINASVMENYSMTTEINFNEREVNNEKAFFFPTEDSVSHSDLKKIFSNRKYFQRMALCH